MTIRWSETVSLSWAERGKVHGQLMAIGDAVDLSPPSATSASAARKSSFLNRSRSRPAKPSSSPSRSSSC